MQFPSPAYVRDFAGNTQKSFAALEEVLRDFQREAHVLQVKYQTDHVISHYREEEMAPDTRCAFEDITSISRAMENLLQGMGAFRSGKANGVLLRRAKGKDILDYSARYSMGLLSDLHRTLRQHPDKKVAWGEGEALLALCESTAERIASLDGISLGMEPEVALRSDHAWKMLFSSELMPCPEINLDKDTYQKLRNVMVSAQRLQEELDSQEVRNFTNKIFKKRVSEIACGKLFPETMGQNQGLLFLPKTVFSNEDYPTRGVFAHHTDKLFSQQDWKCIEVADYPKGYLSEGFLNFQRMQDFYAKRDALEDAAKSIAKLPRNPRWQQLTDDGKVIRNAPEWVIGQVAQAAEEFIKELPKNIPGYNVADQIRSQQVIQSVRKLLPDSSGKHTPYLQADDVLILSELAHHAEYIHPDLRKASYKTGFEALLTDLFSLMREEDPNRGDMDAERMATRINEVLAEGVSDAQTPESIRNFVSHVMGQNSSKRQR